MAGDRVVVGIVTRPHGVRGGVLVKPLSDDPQARFAPGASYLTDTGVSLTLRTVSEHPSGLILGFVELADREAAVSLAGAALTIDASDRRPLASGEYWPEDLIGCAVLDPAGTAVGTVVGYEFGASQDRLVVERADGARGEVPFVDGLVPVVDVGRRVLVADLPEGLFD